MYSHYYDYNEHKHHCVSEASGFVKEQGLNASIMIIRSCFLCPSLLQGMRPKFGIAVNSCRLEEIELVLGANCHLVSSEANTFILGSKSH